MPTYEYTCSECGAVQTKLKKIAERDEVATEECAECHFVGGLNRNVSSPMFAYTITTPGGYGRSIPDGFKDVLKKVHQRTPGSKLNETSSHHF